MVLSLPQAHGVKNGGSGFARRGSAGEFEGQHHIFESGERGQQMKLLEHEAQRVAPYRCARVFIEPAEIVTVQHATSACWHL